MQRLKARCCAVVAGLILAVCGTASARSEEARLAAIQRAGTLKVCIWPEYFAISYRNPRNGGLEGLDVDMAAAFARRLGVRPEFVETNFSDFMGRIEAGDCDIAMFAVGITPSRRQRVDFSEPYIASAVYGVATKANPRIRTWQDIDRSGVSVAVAAGTLMEPLMRDTLTKAKLVVVSAPSTREAEVQAGRVDVFMSDYPYTRRMVLMHDWARIIEPPAGSATTPYAYAVAKGDPEWLAAVNAFIAAARADGTLARAADRHGLTPILLR